MTSSNPKNKESFYRIKQHKTLHRYVIRAKAGGRQSTKDATGKHVRSAGATLRRYNEAALERDIAEILTSWKEELKMCDLIFTAVSSSDAKAVFGGDNPPLKVHDARVRRIPFPTRRPTFAESKRVCQLLMTAFDVPQQTEDTQTPTEPADQPVALKTETEIQCPTETHNSRDQQPSHHLSSDPVEATSKAPSRSSKQKSKRRPKGKDQRRRAAMESAEATSPDPDTTEAQEPDDEVERAIADIQKLQQRRKAQSSQKKPKPKEEPSIEERRKLMRKAAEQRMANLQSASHNQQLW